MNQQEMFNNMDQQQQAPQAEAPKKPRLTGKAKREALSELSSLMLYRSTHETEYEPPEGVRRLLAWLLHDIQAADAKKA